MTYLLLLGLVLFAVVTFGYLFSKRFHADVDAAEKAVADDIEAAEKVVRAELSAAEAYIQASQKAK